MCQVVLTKHQVVVYHGCPFDVEIGKRFVTQKKKIGDYGNALKVIDKIHDRVQLGPLQRDLVAPLWRLISKILE